MPLVHECRADDCSTLTMGEYCVTHESREPEPRQRRFLAVAAAAATLAGFGAAFLARHA